MLPGESELFVSRPTFPLQVSKVKCAKFSIDWHNYMYSILRDKYNLTDEEVIEVKTKKAKIVRCVSLLEGLCGKLSDYNLCVTDAMRKDLVDRWGVEANTFYDRPPTWKFKYVTHWVSPRSLSLQRNNTGRDPRRLHPAFQG